MSFAFYFNYFNYIFLMLLFCSGYSFAESSIDDIFLLDSTRKTTWTAEVVRVKTEKNNIPGLQLVEKKIPVFLVQKDKSFRPLVALEFSLVSTSQESIHSVAKTGDIQIKSSSSDLVQSKENINQNISSPSSALDESLVQLEDNLLGSDFTVVPKSPATGHYMYFVYLTSKKNEVVFYYIDKKHQKHVEKIFIVSEQAQEYTTLSPWEYLRVGLGSTYFSYAQTDYTQLDAWTGLLTLKYLKDNIYDQMGINAEADLSVVTINSNQNKVAMQTAGIKLDGLYTLNKPVQDNWSYQITGGLTYLTTFVSGAQFGFKNLMVPSLGFISRFLINDKEDYELTTRLGLFDAQFKSRGIEFEFSRSYLFSQAQRTEIGLKYIDYGFHPNNEDNNFAQLKIFSVFFRYSL